MDRHDLVQAMKTQVADKIALFLRLSKLKKCEFTAINDHSESKSNSQPRLFRGKTGVFLLTLYIQWFNLLEIILIIHFIYSG